ncbi:magnesium transporter [Peptoclostridium litorale DSM 5388]|uniref:Magnesium transport protein CorA n=1 Tax=Peptoclostridium litorale DSM 5388 TaxID=1121324 RepID=A0A069RE88_PEPLI|nr:magnesium/cobalt transporter CorA [Peptoclostridium litorale]KDR93919.1 magnesium transport protein CorA [Peptoclostridium litorale DSM 5388]KDR95346.1 magnesium transport protein CorA [Peptoclostridium litorale DSM 5388]SIN88571.1 magnesium transporter [Peptoclostridium litorale DSM 5388]
MKLSSVKNVSKKIGLPPGSLVHIGNHISETTSVSLLKYSADSIEELSISSPKECSDHITDGYITWINVTGLSDVNTIGDIGKNLGMHPLILEDILNTSHRAKIDDSDEYISIIIKVLNYNEKDSIIEREQVSIILGDGFVATFQEKKSDIFNGLISRLQHPSSRLRNMKSDYLVYAIIDTIVDNYFALIEHIGDKVESIENMLFESADSSILNEIHNLKREMIFLKKSLWPLREILSSLQRSDSSLIHSSTSMYFRDVYEHIIQILDTIESLRDVLSGMTELFISISGNRMNEIMKVLTIISTIFIPLTFIAGVYGMNFRHMPELESTWFYPWFLYSLMLAIVFGMLAFFKNKKWL